MTDKQLIAAIDRAVLRAVAKPRVLLSIRETGAVLDCPTKRVRELIAAGTLRTKKFGKQVKVPVAEVFRLTSVDEQMALPLGQVQTMLTYEQARSRLSVSLSTLKRMVLDGTIKAVRVGHHPRIPSTEIDRIAGTPMNKPRKEKRAAPAPAYDAKAEAEDFDEWMKTAMRKG